MSKFYKQFIQNPHHVSRYQKTKFCSYEQKAISQGKHWWAVRKLDQLQVRKEEINSNFSDFEHFYDEYGDNWRMLGSVNNWHVNRVVELVQIEEDKIWKELEVIKEEICELTTKILESMSEVEKIEEYCSKHCLDSNGNKK